VDVEMLGLPSLDFFNGAPTSNNYAHAAKFQLNCSLKEFVSLFWEDSAQHIDFLERTMREKNIEISPWSESSELIPEENKMHRTVQVDHPLPVLEWVPWLPAHVRNTCMQTMTAKKEQPRQLQIIEKSVVTAVPMVEPVVLAVWCVEESSDGKSVECSVELAFKDCNVLMLQGLIEYHATAGLQQYFRDWQPHAEAIIIKSKSRLDNSGAAVSPPIGPLSGTLWR